MGGGHQPRSAAVTGTQINHGTPLRRGAGKRHQSIDGSPTCSSDRLIETGVEADVNIFTTPNFGIEAIGVRTVVVVSRDIGSC